MNDLMFLLFNVEMRKIERFHGVESEQQRGIRADRLSRRPDLLAHLTQRAEYAGPIEPLSLAVFTEIRHGDLQSDSGIG